MVCGSHSLFNVARIFGGNLPEKRAMLITQQSIEAPREIVLSFPKPHRTRRRAMGIQPGYPHLSGEDSSVLQTVANFGEFTDGPIEFLGFRCKHLPVDAGLSVWREHDRHLIERKACGTPEGDQRQPFQRKCQSKYTVDRLTHWIRTRRHLPLDQQILRRQFFVPSSRADHPYHQRLQDGCLRQKSVEHAQYQEETHVCKRKGN
jgi:hypothetical protein